MFSWLFPSKNRSSFLKYENIKNENTHSLDPNSIPVTAYFCHGRWIVPHPDNQNAIALYSKMAQTQMIDNKFTFFCMFDDSSINQKKMDKGSLNFVLTFFEYDCSSFIVLLSNVWKLSSSVEVNRNELLKWSVQNGYENLCLYVKEEWWGNNYLPGQFNWIIYRAANLGYEKICILVKNWESQADYDSVLRIAALHGHENICRLAKEWGATDFDGMISQAALGDHENLCLLAKEWGTTGFNLMLIFAAFAGNEKFCRLAKEWGADNFNLMLEYAAKGGHEHLCKLAKEWGATYFHSMLERATTKNIYNLAHEWIIANE